MKRKDTCGVNRLAKKEEKKNLDKFDQYKTLTKF